MNKPKWKLFGGIVLLAVLSVLYCCFLLMINTAVNGVYNLDSQAAKMRAINNSVGGILDASAFAESRELEKFTNRVALASVAARGLIQKDWDGKSVNYDNGVIVTVSGDRIEYPEDYPEEQKIDASSLTDTYGLVSAAAGPSSDTDTAGDPLLVGYYKIGSDAYYLECVRESALEERSRLSFDALSWLQGIEDALGIRILLVFTQENENGSHALLYKSENLPEEVSTAEGYGITNEMLKAVPDSAENVTVEKMLDSSRAVELDGAPYLTFIQAVKGSEFSDEEVYLVYLVPEKEFVAMTVEQTVVVLVAFLIIGIILLVWFFSLIRLVRHYSLNAEQAQQLGAKTTVKKAFTMIGMGSIVILIASAMFLSLLRLYDICNSVKKSLNVLEQRIEESTVQNKAEVEELKSTYVSYAERIAGILKESPELVTEENLQSFSDMIEADYIMIYDHNGKEMISNSRYVDMELGTSPESSTYEFRRLLKGIPAVVHDAQTDEETGLKNAMVGVCLEFPSDPDQYGALLVAVPESKLQPGNLKTMDDVMRSLMAKGTLAFSVNSENKTIVNASEAAMIGRDVVSLGLPEDAIVDSFRDFFTFDNTSCYGESKSIDGLIYYYAAEQSYIYRNVLLYAAIAAAVGFLFLSVLIGYMMIGYRKGFEYWSKEGEKLIERMDEGIEINDDSDPLADPRKRWKLSLSKYGLQTPMHNANVALEILLVGTIIGIGAWYFIRRGSSSGSLLSFVMHGQWTKGLNLFSFTGILILFAQVLIVVSILKILVRVITSSMGTKGETFCRLAQSILTYAGMIFFVYMALYSLGINLGALIASLSLPAFAISLGAKDMITDIVAGISLVFDGEFRVGDIVDINGYRGTVVEIGVRTTKIQGNDNNIKIISNRDVKNVINMSKKTSYYNVDVKVSTSSRLEDVEKILQEELPKLHDKIPGIISGPSYRGVSAIGGKDVILTISAECLESNYGKVKMAMNHAIQDLFAEHGIQIDN